MNNELLEALTILEKEKDISKDTLLEAIENSLITACKNHFGKSDNIKVNINPETCEFHVYAEKTVVEEVEDPVLEISAGNAKMINSKYEVGDIVNVEVKSKEFGRIATQNAKNVILQKIREEERKVLFEQYYGKEKDVVTGIVQRYVGKNISINLGKVDAILSENEQVKSEVFQPTERIKLYILEVKSTSKGPKILVSRTHPELVKRLFESEVSPCVMVPAPSSTNSLKPSISSFTCFSSASCSSSASRKKLTHAIPSSAGSSGNISMYIFSLSSADKGTLSSI